MAVAKIVKEVRANLLKLQDTGNFKAFNASLLPGTDPDTLIGVRTRDMRKYAKEFIKTGDTKVFMKHLPHKYYEENILHVLIITNMKDYDEMMEELEIFLPYIDNWAVCDTLNPGIVKKNLPDFLKKIKEWIASDKTYTIRFAIGMLMRHYLDDEHFDSLLVKLVCDVESQEYYVNMMIAWYLATALAKQWDATLPYIEDRILSKWVQNKTIQKSVESFRITDERKKYLRTLKKI